MMPIRRVPVALSELGLAAWFLVRAGRGHVANLIERDALARRRLADAIDVVVWQPLSTLMALSVLTGLIAGFAVSTILSHYNAEYVIVPSFVHALARDVVPLIIGMFAAGRVSVEIAARLGAMRLNRELDALETLGHDPARHVLTPSLMAVIASAPIHMISAYAGTWLAAGLVLDVQAATHWSQYLALTLTDQTARVLLTGVAKTLLFAFIALGVGAAIGSRDDRGPNAIGHQATSAFTAGLLAIFAAAAMWAALA